jgi:hypothetical protein
LWVEEIRRVLRPGGVCVLRLSAQRATTEAAAVEKRLRDRLGAAEVVEETGFSGIAFSVAGVEDMAISEALMPAVKEPSGIVVLGAASAEGPWSLGESLLVPMEAGTRASLAGAQERASCVARAEWTARYQGVCTERDQLRERLMADEDGDDRRDEMLSALRGDNERYVRQISAHAAELELRQLERDKAERRAASAERALEALSSEVHSLRVQVSAQAKPGAPEAQSVQPREDS